MKFTWVIMTHNKKSADESVKYNLANAGAKVDEIIWVDNGSEKRSEFLDALADRKIFNKTNLGIARGYNPAFAMASGDFIIITGSDTKMPDGWLRIFKDYCEKVPNTGVACMCNVPYEKAPERIQGVKQVINGFEIVPALPLGFRVINKKILKECGYLREDFGLYGWDDVEWAHRISKHSKMLHYIIPGYVPQHDMFHAWDGEYVEFKKREVADPSKQVKLQWCADNNYPIYNPYV